MGSQGEKEEILRGLKSQRERVEMPAKERMGNRSTVVSYQELLTIRGVKKEGYSLILFIS
jgi:hypothetical protein